MTTAGLADASVSLDIAATPWRERLKLIRVAITGERLTVKMRGASFHCTCLHDPSAMSAAARLPFDGSDPGAALGPQGGRLAQSRSGEAEMRIRETKGR